MHFWTVTSIDVIWAYLYTSNAMTSNSYNMSYLHTVPAAQLSTAKPQHSY